MKEIGRFRTLFISLIVIEDLLLINGLFFVLLAFFDITFWLNSAYEILLILINLGYLLSVVACKVKVDQRNTKVFSMIKRSLYRACIILFISLFSLFFIKLSDDISRAFIFIYFAIIFLAFFTTHWGIVRLFANTVNKKKIHENAIILGAGAMGQELCRAIMDNDYLGINVLGFFDDAAEHRQAPHYLGTLDQVEAYAKAHNVSKIYSTLSQSEKNKIKRILDFSDDNVINFYIVPTAYQYANVPFVLESVGQIPILSVRRIPLGYAHNSFLKRSFDVLVSGLFLFIVFPFIYLIFGFVIKLGSKGPVFFKQKRTGKNGQDFICYKFRSMRQNIEADTLQAGEKDPRKTAVGNFMRKTNIDELPQFINVLKGDMSIVGPRPHMIKHTDEFSRLVEKYMVRHFIKPGITGWAQVTGFRGETKTVNEIVGRVKRDVWYIENWSLLLDLKIIVLTIWVTLKGDKKAY